MSLASMILASQCRAARGLLDWNKQEIADKAKVGIVTVRQLEAGTHQPRRATLDRSMLLSRSGGRGVHSENGGGVGVRLRDPGSRGQRR